MAHGVEGELPDDRALMGRARDGDVEAFETLVRRHAPVVYGLSLRLLGNGEDAQDATQDAFLRAWRSLRTFRGGSSFRTWLYRIAANRCLNELERQPRTEPLPEVDVMVAPGPDPERIAQARAQVVDLQRAMATLTPEQRAVLVLREFEHCTHDEVATILGISVGSVKSRLHRARVAVIQAMGPWHDD